MNRTLSLLAVTLLCGCPAKPGPSESGPTEDPRRERARAAAQALGKRLKAKLQAALKEGGPAKGIEACKVAAPEIAAAVGAEQKLKVGRTSFKLRNPKNAPPPWAKAWVDERAATPKFRTAPDGAFQALLPIKLEALCTTCHGDPANLSPEVKATLAQAYPKDQATGFKEGDLRGWFWVELPPTKK